MKNIIIIIALIIIGLRSSAQVALPMGKLSNSFNLAGKWYLLNEPVDGDSSKRIITSGWLKRNVSGGGGAPGGINGDFQIKSGSSFAGSLLNQTGLKITAHTDSNLIIKSVNNPNQFHGISFQDSAGNEIGGFKPNPALGEISIGGLRSAYFPVFYAGNARTMTMFTDGGINIGTSATEHGEKLAVLGQFYAQDFTAIGTPSLGTAWLQLAANSTSKGVIQFTNGTPPTTPVAGLMNYNTGLWIIDSSASKRDTIATRSWVRNNITGGSGGSDTLKVVNEGTPGIRLLRTGHDTLYSKIISNGTVGSDSTLTINTLYTSDGTINGTRTITGGTSPSVAWNGFNTFEVNTSSLITLSGIPVRMVGGVQFGSMTESGAGTLTLDNQSVWYVFTGSTTTWTLPARASNPKQTYLIKNAGSGNITLNRAGSDQIYDTSAVTSLTITPGSAIILVAGGTYWYKQ